jgi:hypothetical protein
MNRVMVSIKSNHLKNKQESIHLFNNLGKNKQWISSKLLFFFLTTRIEMNTGVWLYMA